MITKIRVTIYLKTSGTVCADLLAGNVKIACVICYTDGKENWMELGQENKGRMQEQSTRRHVRK